MTTFTAVAPPLSLFVGPPPEPPPHGLLQYLMRLDRDALRVGPSHFEAGANVWMYPCQLALPHDPCADSGTFETKEDGEDNSNVEGFQAFTAYAPVSCSSLSVGVDYDGFFDRIRVAFEAVESAAVEKELATGYAIQSGTPNPSFADQNMAIPAGASAVTPEVGLRWLERTIGQSGRAGVIHAPPEVAAAWRYDELYIDSAGILRTLANNTPVVSGPGYQDVQPENRAAPAAGTAWAFATGPLSVFHGELIRLADYKESLDRGTNFVTARAERDYLATWDPCIQAGVLVDWTP